MKHALLCLFCCLNLWTVSLFGARQPMQTLQLTTQQQINLEALSSLYGYARYFYPNPQVEKMDCNSSCMSFEETVMEIVKNYHLGMIVGEPTCGTNGDIFLNMRPTIAFGITSFRFRNHDGSQHHGIGVLPDVSVAPTVQGIREGKDEVLEKALQTLKR